MDFFQKYFLGSESDKEFIGFTTKVSENKSKIPVKLLMIGEAQHSIHNRRYAITLEPIRYTDVDSNFDYAGVDSMQPRWSESDVSEIEDVFLGSDIIDFGDNILLQEEVDVDLVGQHLQPSMTPALTMLTWKSNDQFICCVPGDADIYLFASGVPEVASNTQVLCVNATSDTSTYGFQSCI